jgi:hypothetical protein
MKRLLPLAVLALLAACASGPAGPRYQGIQFKPRANPSAVIAAELAFAQLAQDKGQWTAFAETAAANALIFVPEPVVAQGWLKGRANPAQSVRWQPHQVWSSCDGSVAVTRGAWQRPNGTQGYFTTVWQRQKDGAYKWVFDQGDVLYPPLAEPEMIAASVADCTSKQAIAVVKGAWIDSLPASGGGGSDDGSLAYEWSVAPDLSRQFSVSMLKDGETVEVLSVRVAAPQG